MSRLLGCLLNNYNPAMLHRYHIFLLLCLLVTLLLVGCLGSRGEQELAKGVPLGAALRQTATLAPTIAPVGMFATAPTTPSATPLPTATLQPDARLKAAREAERVGDWEQAFLLYESLRLDPTHAADALLHLGDLYWRDDQPIEADAAWRELLLREPDGPYAMPVRYRLARALAADGQYEQAIDLWEQVDEAMDEADALLAQRLADAYASLGDADAAAEQLQRVYALPGADRVSRARAAYRVGDWLAAEERWREALAWYERTLKLSEIDTFRAQVIARIAEAAQEMGDEGNAYDQWLTLVKEYPDTPEAIAAAGGLEKLEEPIPVEELGKIYLENGRWTEAVRIFTWLLEDGEHSADIHQQAALALEGAGNWTAAQKEWEKIIETHPEATKLHDDALLGIGRTQVQLGDPAAAYATWKKVIDRFPKGDAAPEALWERAQALHRAGADVEDVAAVYERLAEAYPQSEHAGEALWEAGWLWYEGGKPEEAVGPWRQLAEQQGDRKVQAFFWAGKAASQSGNADLAEVFWKIAAGQEPMGYYGLRAAALLEGEAWQPRAERDYNYPPTEDTDLSWLYEAADLRQGDRRLQGLGSLEVEEPLFQQGEALRLFDEREMAISLFVEAIDARGEDPLELWSLANRFRDLDLPSLSIAAALRLMELLDYSALDAPLPLVELAYPIPYDEALQEASAQRGFDPLFFAALIHQESRWEAQARSYAAARGLTQVIPDTGSWIATHLGDGSYEYRKLDHPIISLRYGSYYLDFVLDQFNDNPFHALAAYNAGPGNAQRWSAADDDLFFEQITSSETRTYVEQIYRHWHAYQRIYRTS
ncbi:MAG: transglycosylase SLT domain-containing protein [Chloroflexota bacterium]|nr:transglycosylase SLT domain-containing protein [Chloroflexota bacterium]